MHGQQVFSTGHQQWKKVTHPLPPLILHHHVLLPKRLQRESRGCGVWQSRPPSGGSWVTFVCWQRSRARRSATHVWRLSLLWKAGPGGKSSTLFTTLFSPRRREGALLLNTLYPSALGFITPVLSGMLLYICPCKYFMNNHCWDSQVREAGWLFVLKMYGS